MAAKAIKVLSVTTAAANRAMPTTATASTTVNIDQPSFEGGSPKTTDTRWSPLMNRRIATSAGKSEKRHRSLSVVPAPRSVKWRLWAAVGLVVASLAATVNAYRPLARNGRLSMVAMASSLLTSELPLQVIAGQLGVLAWLSRRLPRPWRWVLWLASAVSWLGLIGLHRHGRRADVPLTAALEV